MAGAVVLTVAGCNFAPRYQRPETDTPGQFKEAVPGGNNDAVGWKIAEPKDATLRGRWWELYQDPQLNALEERVSISNQTVAAAEANYRAAHALVLEARAGFFPSVNLTPAATRSRTSSSSGSGSSGGASSGSAGKTQTVYSLPIGASYELDLWGRIRNAVAQSAFAAQASAADVATALLSTQSELAQDYFQLRAVDEQRKILDTTLADYEASLHLVDALFRNGLASDEDLAQAKTQLDSAEAQATDLGVSRGQLEHAIAILTGVPPAKFFLAVLPFNPTVPVVPLSLPGDLLERRPDIAAAERQVAAANAGVGIARAAFFPSISLTGGVGYQTNNGLSQLFNWPNRFWSAGASMTEPLFEGGTLFAATAQARAEYDAAVANYRQTVLTAFQSVEDNLISLRVLATEEEQQHQAVIAAQRELQLATARYKLGLDSYVNVITAQNTFLTNRETELQIQLRRITASINLIDNLGGGWDTTQWKQTEQLAMQASGTGKKTQASTTTTGIAAPNPPPVSDPPNPP
jgi:NodT family efflux transporter outer membrane factor (OMF) lipoprotein